MTFNSYYKNIKWNNIIIKKSCFFIKLIIVFAICNSITYQLTFDQQIGHDN